VTLDKVNIKSVSWRAKIEVDMTYDEFIAGITWTKTSWGKHHHPLSSSYDTLLNRGNNYWLNLQNLSQKQLAAQIITGFLNTREWNCHLDSPNTTKGAQIISSLASSLQVLPPYYRALNGLGLEQLDYEQQIGNGNAQLSVLDIVFTIYSSYLLIKPRFGPVPTSKLMHMALPNLFLMWDNSIFDAYEIRRDLTNRRSYFYFMILMQENLSHILATKGILLQNQTALNRELNNINKEFNYTDYSFPRLLDMANYAVGHLDSGAPQIKCSECIARTNAKLQSLKQSIVIGQFINKLEIKPI
jgi:hypothetical protein